MRTPRKLLLAGLVAITIPLGVATLPAAQHTLAGAAQRGPAPHAGDPPHQPRAPKPPRPDLTPPPPAPRHDAPANLTAVPVTSAGNAITPAAYPTIDLRTLGITPPNEQATATPTARHGTPHAATPTPAPSHVVSATGTPVPTPRH